MVRKFLFAMLLASIFAYNFSWAAQSTADVPISDKTMAEAREKVLGQKTSRAVSADQYVIGIGDILNVTVYGEGDMAAIAQSSQATAKPSQGEEQARTIAAGIPVRVDGRISLKHLGDVDAVGYTPTQLADYLKELYKSVFSEPNVTVVVVQSNSQRYTVLGKVAKPGVYFMDYPVDIVQAVARSGGFTEWAKKQITVVRKDPKNDKKLFKKNKLEFDYGDFIDGKDLEKNVILETGDTVVVD